MTSRYPRQRAEDDRKKRRAADITISVSMYCDENVRKIASDERSREEHAARMLNA
jgi:hypothetical protein